jgi:hypothetical protein
VERLLALLVRPVTLANMIYVMVISSWLALSAVTGGVIAMLGRSGSVEDEHWGFVSDS